MMPAARRYVSLALRLKGLAQRERKSRLSLPLSSRLAAWRRGFVSESVVNYGLDGPESGDYLSDFARHARTPDINERFKAVLDNKLLFSKIFTTVRKPQLFFWLDGGRVFSFCENRLVEIADIIDRCRADSRLVVKPVDGGGGARVFVIEIQENRAVLNRTEIAVADLERFLARLNNVLVMEFLEQHAYAKAIFPYATNTIRILTMWDYEAGAPFIAAAVHRFGRTATIPVDNWSRGGLSVAIDLQRGRLGKGKMHPSTGDREWHSSHPETRQQLEGVHVPGWIDVWTQILEAARTVPFLPYIGWDIVVVEDGFAVLEGNNFSDVNLIQVHAPLLVDPRVRRFYEYHGVIKRKSSVPPA